jgi:hypothetical protein
VEHLDVIPLQVERTKARSSRRKRLLAGLGALIVATVIVLLSRGGRKNQGTPKYQSSIPVWDTSACETQNFPVYSDEDRMNELRSSRTGKLRIASGKMYCAHQWDDGYLASTAKTLESNGLLMTQLLPAGMGVPQDAYAAMPPPVANFVKIFDSGPLLLEPEYIDRLAASSPIELPKGEMVKHISDQIGMDRICTLPNALPQVYPVHENMPAIHLITDVGIATSLREVIRLELAGVFSGAYIAAEKKLANLSGGIQREVETNPYALGITSNLATYLRTAISQRETLFAHSAADQNYHLPDLEIQFIERSEHSTREDPLHEREGSYDPHASRIYVRAPHLEPSKKEVLPEDVMSITSSLAPASLEHEFFHYLFYRPSVGGSGFILEGEATANGERLRQIFVAGANTNPANSSDPLRVISEKIMSAPLQDVSSADWAEFNRLAAERVLASPMTPVQCASLKLVHERNIKGRQPIPLLKLLTLTPSMFQDGPDVRLAYAQAWAVYHVDLVEGDHWGEALDEIVRKLNSHVSPTDEEIGKLTQINDKTLGWVKETWDKGGSRCLSEETTRKVQ